MSSIETTPPGDEALVHAFGSEYWEVRVTQNSSAYRVSVHKAGYGKQFFWDEIDLSNDGRAGELCHLLREACSLKNALEAGISRDQWFFDRARFGLPLPSAN
jgi:hypothetical protein